jgi:hypothetical protein
VAGYFNASKRSLTKPLPRVLSGREHWHLLTMADDANTLLEMLSLKEIHET